jgi:MoxR-like ATPase
MAPPVLRHRLVLNYNAESEGETPDSMIRRLLDAVPMHRSGDKGARDGRVEQILKA